MRDAFDRTARGRPEAVHEVQHCFGDYPARFRIVGDALARHVLRPFAHLRTEATRVPSLTVDLWDEAETGVGCPDDRTLMPVDGEWRIAGGATTVFGHGRFFRYQFLDGVTWLDRSTGHMVGWRASARTVTVHERSKPLPLLLPIWYRDRQRHIIHAGLVARHGQGVLVGGSSGGGKTTVSLASLLDGFDYLSDDHIAVRAVPDGSFVGHSLYNCARVTREHLARFSPLLPYAIPGDTDKDKWLLLVADVLPERLQRAAAIRAIVLPRFIASDATRVRRASKGEALLRLAPTSVYTPFGSGAAGFEQLSRLIETVPSYCLEFGPKLGELPRRLDEILEEATA